MHSPKRRNLLRASAAAGALAVPALHSLLWSREARAQIGDTLTIAYNVSPPQLDPNSGSSSFSPGLQSVFRSLYDPFFMQKDDLSFAPGVCDEFVWSADKATMTFRVRQGVTWHDGRPVTPQDIAWNLRRLQDPAAGNPLHGVFAAIKNIKVQGNHVAFDVSPWRVNIFERLTSLACFLLPQHYLEKAGKEGFEKRPIGSGPYMFEQFERGSFLRLKANKSYWGGAPAFETVVFKFTTDAATRIAEIERGSSDITLDMPWEEFDRLKTRRGLTSVATPVVDIGLIHFNNVGVMSDPNVRKAAVHAIDKKAIAERIHRGYARPIDTLLTPEYKGYDASITTAHNPRLAAELLAKSGHTRDKPVEFTVQTTRNYKPKDYETIQAIVEMWRRVGIRANIEVYEITKHFELVMQHKLAPAAFGNWTNPLADPDASISNLMHSKAPFSSWKGGELDAQLQALLVEKDDAKRMEGYKAVNRTIAENAYVLPLLQFYQPVVFKSALNFQPHLRGFVLPQTVKRSR